jgi:uncharacterized protein
MLLGTVAAIWRYPAKSLRGEALEQAEITAEGLPGDRAAALFVRAGHAREGKTYRGKEDDRLHLGDDIDAARLLAAERGVDVEIRKDGAFFDDSPISLILDCWLDEVSAHVGYPVEPERFRPNFFVRTSPAFTAPEDALNGAELLLGSARLRVRYPIERCVAVTYDPAGGPSDARILRYVAQHRAAWMGVYCDVLEPGRAQIGDELRQRYAY